MVLERECGCIPLLGQRDSIEVPVDRGVHPGIVLRVLAWHQFSAPNRFGSLNHSRFGQRRDTSTGRSGRLSPGPTGIAKLRPGLVRDDSSTETNRNFPSVDHLVKQ